jgi:hypothetical protein
MAASTRSRVSADICWCRPLTTLDTVETETPAAFATDLIVTRSFAMAF